jgi:uncharacterized protein YndB with AHSA1/START domain
MAAQVETTIAAPCETIFEILSDPETYVQWEVGSSAILQTDSDWPEPGAMFEHTHGKWGVHLRDTTRVLEAEPPRRLVLEARVRPVTVAEVEFRLDPRAEGCNVTMVERTTGGLLRFTIGPLRDLALDLRNREMLRRLRRLAESRAQSGG